MILLTDCALQLHDTDTDIDTRTHGQDHGCRIDPGWDGLRPALAG